MYPNHYPWQQGCTLDLVISLDVMKKFRWAFLAPVDASKKKEFEMKKVNVKCRWRTNIHCICNYCEKILI
jgi:hypothetical protein